MSDTITATVRYVHRGNKRPENEKPYILQYPTSTGLPANNFEIHPVPGIKIRNFRTAHLTYEEHGIKVASIDSSKMPPENFDDDDWIEKEYLPELHQCVCDALGANDVTIFDWLLRKRSPSFPQRETGEKNEEAIQPSLSAHIDYTAAELNSRADRYFGNEKDALLNRRYQVINIWKPLTGPCRDFPMAYLDPKSVNRETDLLAVDEVFPKVANEVFQVYHNPNHMWYYVPDQLDSEVTIFNAFDSEKGQSLAVPHCSFDLGDDGSGVLRQSIEVRAFVFY